MYSRSFLWQLKTIFVKYLGSFTARFGVFCLPGRIRLFLLWKVRTFPEITDATDSWLSSFKPPLILILISRIYLAGTIKSKKKYISPNFSSLWLSKRRATIWFKGYDWLVPCCTPFPAQPLELLSLTTTTSLGSLCPKSFTNSSTQALSLAAHSEHPTNRAHHGSSFHLSPKDHRFSVLLDLCLGRSIHRFQTQSHASFLEGLFSFFSRFCLCWISSSSISIAVT